MKAKIGDWVRFYRGGILIIGVVNYIGADIWCKDEYFTDAGVVSEDSVKEVRSSNG